LFDGYLRSAKTCAACGLNFGSIQAGDGPTGLVILLVGAIIAGSALLVEVAYQPPYWLHAAIWVPAIVILCVGLLRPFKAGMMAVYYRQRIGK
jgi:uncharacterized protein (DUF983 family)